MNVIKYRSKVLLSEDSSQVTTTDLQRAYLLRKFESEVQLSETKFVYVVGGDVGADYVAASVGSVKIIYEAIAAEKNENGTTKATAARRARITTFKYANAAVPTSPTSIVETIGQMV
jgi:hypothetical protein